MRILCSALLGLFFTLISHTVYAACGPNALGTHRTIEIDARDHKRIIGKERSLGLRDKEVILTFDDGPIAGKTARILKALRKECVKATFFAVAKMAKYQPKLLRRIVRDGHTLAHHTYNHNRLPAYSTRKAEALVDRGINMVEKIAYGKANKTPRVPFFRYPYLSRTNATNRMMARKGLIIFDANIDAADWKRVSANTVHNRIMRRLRSERKGIILMHDIQSRTARMLPRLLRSLKAEGYKVVHVVPRRAPALKPKPTKPKIPVVVASAKKEAAKPKARALVALELDKSLGDFGVPPLPEFAGSPAEAHGTKIDSVITLGSHKPKSVQPSRDAAPVSALAPVTRENTSSIKGRKVDKSFVTHSINATRKKVAAVDIAQKARLWKLRPTQ